MKMRKRIMIVLIILTVLASVLILSWFMDSNPHVPAYTKNSRGVATTAGVYYYENWHGKGYLYLLDYNGSATKIVNAEAVDCNRIEQICVSEGNVYALYSATRVKEGKLQTTLRAVAYDASLVMLGLTDEFLIDPNEELTGLSYSDQVFYVTAVAYDGKSINVYSVDGSELKDPESLAEDKDEKAAEPSEPEVFIYRDDPGGAFYVDALYRDASLYVLTDNEEPYGPFMMDSRIRNAVDHLTLDTVQKLSFYRTFIALWACALIAGILLILLAFRLLVEKNRMMYIYVGTEVLYIVLLICWLFFARATYVKSLDIDYQEYAQMALSAELDYMKSFDGIDFNEKDFYLSEDYRKLASGLEDFIERGSNPSVFADVFVLGLDDGRILASFSGNNMVYASYVYGRELIDLREELNKRAGTEMAMETIYPDGIRMNAIAYKAVGSKDPSLALTGICRNGLSNEEFWSSYYRLVPSVILAFLIGSAAIALIMYLQSLDLLQFVNAIENVALGRELKNIPQVPARDVRAMWTSLSELYKKMQDINHEKFRIYEAYYRFAPKNIETIMDKDSIFDVSNGGMVHKSGRLLLFSIGMQSDDKRSIKGLVNIVTYMAEFTDENDGILVSYDSALGTMDYLFLHEDTRIMEKTNRFLHRNAFDDDSEFVSAFLYRDDFTYGIVGAGAQSLSFLTTKYIKQMKNYAIWFEELMVPMVVTEDILNREDIGENRYIGFIAIEDFRIRLYEILDACPAKERQQKIVQREKFEKTLASFHKGDYYRARNQFSEILRDCPEDLIVRWYIFECERYLNGEADPIAAGRLRATYYGR
ncbi:MAG: hypothetical protein K5770_17085 [Lachnospiraceae bacterium]|nr:hypothetical protein [Lachnospiraceae bacterium]